MKNKNIKDFAYTLGANSINVLGGVITALVIPKILNINEYAYFRIFTLYVTYVGIFQFGFNDGVLVNYGSYEYDDIPKKKFKTYFNFLLLFQLITAVIIFVASFIMIKEPIKRDLFYLLAFNGFILNLSTFFSFISQFTRKFKLYSYSMIASKLLYIVGCIVLFILKIDVHMAFVMLTTGANLFTLIIFLYYNKDILQAKSQRIMDLKDDIKENFSSGFLMMIGNLITLIILGLDRIFIEKYFTLRDFAMYSFAYSIITLFYLLINSFSTVVFPYIARLEGDKLGKAYSTIKKGLNLVLSLSFLAFFFIKFIIQLYLPKYMDSLPLVLVLTPTVLFSGQITILALNYYKALKLNKEYTKNNIFAFVLAIICNFLACVIIKTPVGIAWATLLAFLIWNIYSDAFFVKTMHISLFKETITGIILSVGFVLCAYIDKWYLGFLSYLIIYSVIVVLFFFNDLKNIGRIKEVLKKRGR
ncbi:oligosaccharide flippase family protein [Clostridium sp. C8-1-8]|uniref:oligosaccharide flippase family protein n=1 Tax=Clostridium sp. C8-1-8 TaxID=2698831 RepID=UPI0013681B86|nr:oligosaccharide flippase family protein [Clostridium sp. C8-1-8]